MIYKLIGAEQIGLREWNWFNAKTKVKIESGDMLLLIDFEKYQLNGKCGRIRKRIMNLMGYRFYYSNNQDRYVIVHNSIIERYFTELS